MDAASFLPDLRQHVRCRKYTYRFGIKRAHSPCTTLSTCADHGSTLLSRGHMTSAMAPMEISDGTRLEASADFVASGLRPSGREHDLHLKCIGISGSSSDERHIF